MLRVATSQIFVSTKWVNTGLEWCLAHSRFYFCLPTPATYAVHVQKAMFQWMNEHLGSCLYWLSLWPENSYIHFKALRMEKCLPKNVSVSLVFLISSHTSFPDSRTYLCIPSSPLPGCLINDGISTFLPYIIPHIFLGLYKNIQFVELLPYLDNEQPELCPQNRSRCDQRCGLQGLLKW